MLSCDQDGRGAEQPHSARRWLSRKEVAELLGISVSTLERWHRRDMGPRAYRLAGLRFLRYDPEEVRAFVQREGN